MPRHRLSYTVQLVKVITELVEYNPPPAKLVVLFETIAFWKNTPSELPQ